MQRRTLFENETGRVDKMISSQDYKTAYKRIGKIRSEVHEADIEFTKYCLYMKCKECPMRDVECQTSTYLELKESGVIK